MTKIEGRQGGFGSSAFFYVTEGFGKKGDMEMNDSFYLVAVRESTAALRRLAGLSLAGAIRPVPGDARKPDR